MECQFLSQLGNFLSLDLPSIVDTRQLLECRKATEQMRHNSRCVCGRWYCGMVTSYLEQGDILSKLSNYQKFLLRGGRHYRKYFMSQTQHFCLLLHLVGFYYLLCCFFCILQQINMQQAN